MVTAREVRELLEERPDLEPAVETVLAADDPWTFEDVDVDSGRFGELVSRGVVEKGEDGYRVTDSGAVRAGLSGDVTRDDEREFEFSVDVDRHVAGALAGGLAFLVAVRLFAWPAVFREGAVVLSANDPYYYLYLVETMLTDPSVSAGNLPFAVEKGEPLLVVALATVTRLLGGIDAAPAVLAWYPVVAALLSGLLVYALARALTDDRRVALAAVVLLAVVPGHAFRTGLGFADHHAFDYPWIVLTAVALAALYRERADSRRSALAALSLGVGIAGQTLAWEAGPLLVLPVGVVVAVGAVLDVREGRNPLDRAPVAAGVGLAAALAWLAHARLDWHTALVAGSPALLFVGVVGVFGVATVVHRLDLPVAALAGAEVAGLVGGPLLLAVLAPEWWATVDSRVTGLLSLDRNIAETQGLFGDSFGWLLLFGFVLVLALPYMAWALARSRQRRAWLVPGVYAWYLLVLAAVQLRFAGELGAFAALFGGLGFVHLAETVDLARTPGPLGGDATTVSIPDSQGFVYLVVLFLLVGGLGLVQIPVKTQQVTIEEGQYGASVHVADYDDRHDAERQYVLSEWSYSRHYNYFVNGNAGSYGYAASTYDPFVLATDGEEAHQRIGGRAGYVVTNDRNYPEGSVGSRLHTAYGGPDGNGSALSRYRAIYASPDGRYKAFAVVPGAVVRGEADPNATVTLATEQSIPGASFTYETTARANETGAYAVRVPYPGTYDVAGSGTVEVPESAVTNGSDVRA